MVAAKDLIALQSALGREIESRDSRVSKLELIPLPKPIPRPRPGPDPAPDAKQVFIPGTLTLFLAREGSRAMTELRAALAKSEAAVVDVIVKYQKPAMNRKEVSLEEAQRMMFAESAFASVAYGDRELATGLFLPKGVDLAVVVFPYAGGSLLSGGLQLREFLKDGAKGGLSALVVKADPNLTAAEKAALRAVPKEMLGRNVGAAFDCETTGYAVAAVVLIVVLAVVAFATAGCVAAVDKHIDESRLKQLGSRASLKALLDLRRETIAQTVAARR